VQKEMRDLSGRQQRLARVTREVSLKAGRPGETRID
jgi:hypothetical protein